MSTFDDAFIKVVGIEGGYSNNPSDSGGETMYGITIAVARAFGYIGPMRELPLSTAKAIYKRNYWDKLKLDSMDYALAECLFNIGVNSGVGRAGQFLQAALNAFNCRGEHYPDITVDGDVGPGTLSALNAFKRRRKEANTIVKAIVCQYGNFLLELTQKREKDEDFAYGWFSKRVFV